MPRRLRKDYAGAWHHVMNRGIARRTLFETGKDVRYFLSRLARQVRAGNLEVHSYAAMNTHFHLLVRSPRGRLSDAMQMVEDAYARAFNRSRRRDGPLFRGRFVNRVIESETYWLNVLRYIDRNPVSAGLARSAVEYRFGSARHYAGPAGKPRWLTREVVELAVRPGEDRPFTSSDYVRFCLANASPAAQWVVERRLARGWTEAEDPLDDLLAAAPARVRDWMERKARLADGTSPGMVLLAPTTVVSLVAGASTEEPTRALKAGGRTAPFWEVVEAGILRTLSGLNQDEIAIWMRIPRGTVRERLKCFHAAFAEDGGFREITAGLLCRALATEHPREAADRVARGDLRRLGVVIGRRASA